MSILEQALIFIVAAVILVPLCQRLKLSSVIGYLVAGILIGPHALQLIPDTESVSHFAELGMVLLLFLIGIEIQPGKLWSMRGELLGLGGLQVVLSTILFAGIGMALGLVPVTAGVVGFGLSLSSTAFALQTLSERNQLKTEFGRSSFAILLMQDLIAIPALAIIPNLSKNSQDFSWTSIIPSFLVIGGLLFASRLLFRPLFRIIAATRMREIFTATTLLIVLGVSVLMQKIGLSAGLGSFLAGVLLADSEYRHEIEANVEPFKGLLMGLFFIAVGMGVSLDLIVAQPFQLLGLALGYLAIKSLLIYACGRMVRMHHENSKRMALTIAQGGEFAFVIFAMALQFNLAESDLVSKLTVVITLSMALNPILAQLAEWWGQGAKAPLKPDYDHIKDETPQVIIAGFGRFGQIFGRILRAQGIPFVAIDHDPEHIELVRRFGNKVYYGDAVRHDLLESAGAAKAKYLILAIDDVEASLEGARRIKESYPHLKIFARARNRGHAFDLMDLNVDYIKRETLDSSVSFVGDLLVDMGMPRDRAETLVERFKRHDELMLKEQYKIRHDNENLMSLARQGTLQLEEVMREDSIRTYVDPAPANVASANPPSLN